jgi:hypothetical protein
MGSTYHIKISTHCLGNILFDLVILEIYVEWSFDVIHDQWIYKINVVKWIISSSMTYKMRP